MALQNNPRNNALAGLCERIKAEMAAYTGSNTPEILQTPTGLLSFSQSAANLNGVSAIDLGVGAAGYTELRVTYMQRDTLTDVQTTRSYDCDYPEEALLEETVTADSFLGTTGVSVSMDQIRQLCEDPNTMGPWFQRNIAKSMNTMRRNLNRTNLTNLVSGCIGVNINNLVSAVPSAAAKDVTILNSDGENLNNGMNTIRIDYSDMEFGGMPNVIGTGNFERFELNANRGCCNDGGFDNSRSANDVNWWKDIDVTGLLGTNHILVMAPTVFQIFFVNPYRGFTGPVTFQGDTAYMTLEDPLIPNLEYGLKITFDSCEDRWNISFGTWFAQHCIPSDAFAAADRLSGVNGIYRYRALQAP